jgi:predicted acylesterase/phospholipase RssA
MLRRESIGGYVALTHSVWFRGSILFAALGSSSCSYMRTGYLLDQLNAPSTPETGVPVVSVSTRVARLTRDSLADAYLEPPAVAAYMNALAADSEPLGLLASCLAGDPPVAGYAKCYDRFIDTAVNTSKWGVPDAPSSVDTTNPSEKEIDAERFLANVMAIGPSLSALQHVIGEPVAAADLKNGIQRGASDAAAYITARKWHRQLKRPSTALVLSGGAANGAFTAGAMWRLFEILDACRGAAVGGCGDARIDMVAGTSTGSLIGVIVDTYFAGKREEAKKLLMDNYTCSVESDLYCVNSTWMWNLAKHTRGLVHFDGIYNRLDKAIIPELEQNATELVTVSVDYASGDVYGVSDQDPVDFGPPLGSPQADLVHHQGRINAVMASIVEPVMADPVDWVPGRGSATAGTFIDGGIRSGLPVMQAMQRGAERVLIFSNSGIEPDRMANPPNALKVFLRSLDLLVAQPRIGEVQQAEYGAVARRFAEYNICQRRLGEAAASAPPPAATPAPSASAAPGKEASKSKPGPLPNPPAVPHPPAHETPSAAAEANINAFCERSAAGFKHPTTGRIPMSATSLWMGIGQFPQVASSWRSAWVYRPEKGQLKSAAGYSFTPAVMRPLFQGGIATFQQRCREFTDLLDIHGDIAARACEERASVVMDRAIKKYAPEASCTNKPERRTCP